MLRVFLDANVLFSASNNGSNIARLIYQLIEQDEAITSDFAVAEARRNIQLKRPFWTNNFETLIPQIHVVPSIQFNLLVELSPKDQPILCTAIRSGCHYLVTGDRRDFGHLYDHAVEGVTIGRLTRLAEIIRASSTKVRK